MPDITEADRRIAAQSAEIICKTLAEFIAPCCREAAQSRMLEVCLESGLEFTVKAVRHDYEAMKAAAVARG